MNKEKAEYYAHLSVTLIGALLIGYVFIKYLFGILLPFLIAWGTAFILRPISYKLSEKTGLPRRVLSVAVTVLLLSLTLSLVTLGLWFGLSKLWEWLSDISSGGLGDILASIIDPFSKLFGEGEAADELRREIGEALRAGVGKLLSMVLVWLTDFAKSIPRVALFLLVTVISSVYFSLDLDRINGFVKRLLPKSAAPLLVKLKSKFLTALLHYLRAYLTLAVITFSVLLMGFLILGIKNALPIAALLSLLDALPLIGVGTVIVPWSVLSFIKKNVFLGVGLLLLLVVYLFIRQFSEPKIVGKNLGVHPVVSLVLLYFGYGMFGFLGLLLIPLLSVAVKVGAEFILKEK